MCFYSFYAPINLGDIPMLTKYHRLLFLDIIILQKDENYWPKNGCEWTFARALLVQNKMQKFSEDIGNILFGAKRNSKLEPKNIKNLR